MPKKPLTEVQRFSGLAEARRIINNAEGFYFAGELVPFAPEFKELALQAISETEQRAILTHLLREQVKDACHRAMAAGAKICLPVSEKDLREAKALLEPLYHEALALYKEEKRGQYEPMAVVDAALLKSLYDFVLEVIEHPDGSLLESAAELRDALTPFVTGTTCQTS